MKESKTSDRFNVAVASLILLCVALAVSLSSAGCSPVDECTLDDFNASEKVEVWVVYDIQHKGLELTDEMELILYFDHRIKAEEEIGQLEDILVEFRIESAYPTGWGPTWLYSARCVIGHLRAVRARFPA